jgi:hypothetical protein
MLIEAKADLTAEDRRGATPLIVAAQEANLGKA